MSSSDDDADLIAVIGAIIASRKRKKRCWVNPNLRYKDPYRLRQSRLLQSQHKNSTAILERIVPELSDDSYVQIKEEFEVKEEPLEEGSKETATVDTGYSCKWEHEEPNLKSSSDKDAELSDDLGSTWGSGRQNYSAGGFQLSSDEDEEAVIRGAHRKRRLPVGLQPFPSSQSSLTSSCHTVTSSTFATDGNIATSSNATHTPITQEVLLEEEEEVDYNDLVVSDYKDLNKMMTWSMCNPEVNNEKDIPEWTGSMPVTGEPLEPFEYFRKFVDFDLLNLICQESNLYAIQKDPSKPLSLSVNELEVFLGICFYMSVVKMKLTRKYWRSEANIKSIIDYMSYYRWEKILSNLHFADNAKTPAKGTPQYDEIYKVRPFLMYLKGKFNLIPMNKNVCVDEQMILYKGTQGPHCHTKSKPNTWSYRVWTLADCTGIVHNFEVCLDKPPQVEGFPDLKSSANIVCKLASIIPQHKNHRLFMDDRFSTLPLFFEMFKRGILCMGTVRSNRLSGLEIIPDKDLKKKGKSAYVEYNGELKDFEESIRVVRWNVNNLFTLMSTMGSAQPVHNIGRWDKSMSASDKTEIDRPAMVHVYNTNMGGVDKIDSLISLYKVPFRSKKWYHRVFFHFLDLCVCNAWLLYRRDMKEAGYTKYINLHNFKLIISECLRKQNKPVSNKRRDRPSSTAIDDHQATKKARGHNTKPIPAKAIREDNTGHYLVPVLKRGRCRNPTCKSSPKTWCLKCEVFLCNTLENKCYLQFHGVSYDAQALPK